MWCTSTDESPGSSVTSQPHHRIVRIPPGESVVLNSAERAPYLLIIEILYDDLDFDPRKRVNRDVLKRIVAKEEAKKKSSRGHSLGRSPSTSGVTDIRMETTVNTDTTPEEGPTALPVVVLPATPNGVEEEMDLVEQVYGPDQLLRSRPIDMSESIVLPPPPKNKELDMAAWSRQGSFTPSSQAEQFSFRASPLSATNRAFGSHQEINSSTPGTGRFLSLDEYSERMRTAAIMLTQLNANLVREAVTPLALTGTPANASEQVFTPRSGRLPGSNWLSNPGGPLKQKGPLHPSLSSNLPDNTGSAPATPTRMKLQPTEAAAIRDRIMKEMLALEEERMERMRGHRDSEDFAGFGAGGGNVLKTPDDEKIIRRELDKADPSAVVFSEPWATKKVR